MPEAQRRTGRSSHVECGALTKRLVSLLVFTGRPRPPARATRSYVLGPGERSAADIRASPLQLRLRTLHGGR